MACWCKLHLARHQKRSCTNCWWKIYCPFTCYCSCGGGPHAILLHSFRTLCVVWEIFIFDSIAYRHFVTCHILFTMAHLTRCGSSFVRTIHPNVVDNGFLVVSGSCLPFLLSFLFPTSFYYYCLTLNEKLLFMRVCVLTSYIFFPIFVIVFQLLVKHFCFFIWPFSSFKTRSYIFSTAISNLRWRKTRG